MILVDEDPMGISGAESLKYSLVAGSAEIKGSHSFQFPWDGIAQKERLSQRCVSLMPQWANHVSGVVDSVPAAFNILCASRDCQAHMETIAASVRIS